MSVDWKQLFSDWTCLTASDAAILTKTSRPTACRQLLNLEKKGKLQKSKNAGQCHELLRGIWYWTKGKHPHYGFTHQHHRAVVRSVSWILQQFPRWHVFSERYLRYKFGWYNKLAPHWSEMAPYYTYVPDALFKIEDKYIRLEVQLSRVTDNYFTTMLEVARDKHPVLLVCLPEQLYYFKNKCHSIRRIHVVALGDNSGLSEIAKQFGLVCEVTIAPERCLTLAGRK